MNTKTFTSLTEKFDWVNSDIGKHFTLEPVRSEEYKLFHFDKTISSEDAIKEIERAGYAPATLHELLKWKEWNESDFVIAFGSVAEVGGGRHVPCLDRNDSRRNLGLDWFDSDWGSYCRFLAVRNSVPSTLEHSPSDTLDLEARVKKIEDVLKHHNLLP